MTMIPHPRVLITTLIVIALAFLPKENQAAGAVPPKCKDELAIGAIFADHQFYPQRFGDQLLHTGCNTFGPVFANKIRSFLIAPGIGAACEFYDGDNCKGQSLWVAEDRSNGFVGENTARSAMCGIPDCNQDYAGTVFEDPIFRGGSQTLKMNCTTIDRHSWKTGVSSYVIFPGRRCTFIAVKDCEDGYFYHSSYIFTNARQSPYMDLGDDRMESTYCVPVTET